MSGQGFDILRLVPPHDSGAEQSVLGAILLNPEAAFELAADIVEKDDFYHGANRLIFEAMSDLVAARVPIDPVTLLAQLNGHAGDAGGAPYIAETASFVPTALNIEAYAQIVREKSTLRKLATFGTEISARAYESADLEELVAVAEYEIAAIAGKLVQKPEPGKRETLATVIWKLKHGQEDSVPTGFAGLDQSFGGFNVGHLTMLAARTSKGKSAFATHIALNAAKAGFATAYFTLEMTAEEMWRRAIGCEARVDLFRLRRCGYRDQDDENIAAARKVLESIPLEILYRPSMRPRDLRIEVKRLARRIGPLKLICIDYFNLMRGDRHESERWREMQEAILALKSLAGELGVPILLLSQLNRDAKENEPPQLSNLRDTGASEEHASNILFIWQRPPKDDAQQQSLAEWEDVELIIGKQRNGPAGIRVPMKFAKRFGKFAA